MVAVVILAGGKGKRLWPLSREDKPKQFIKIGESSLLQRTYARCLKFVPPEDIYVVTNKKYRGLTLEEISVPEENLLGEPFARNTAPAVGWASKVISSLDPRATIVVLPADHLIRKEEIFLHCLDDAVRVASRGGQIITFGIVPTFPATGYGYIKSGEALDASEGRGNPVYQVLRFEEKPDRRRSEKFLSEGNYYWNSGMFVFRVDKMLEEFGKHLPQLSRGLEELEDFPGFSEDSDRMADIYAKLPAISLDYGIMEKTENAAVMPVEVGWSDVGDWVQLKEFLSSDKDGNSVVGNHEGVDTGDCLIYGESDKKVIATFGIDDLVIVDTENALLVMDKSKAQDLKRLVNKFEGR